MQGVLRQSQKLTLWTIYQSACAHTQNNRQDTKIIKGYIKQEMTMSVDF